jgi:phosphate transport system substrate-binding protein
MFKRSIITSISLLLVIAMVTVGGVAQAQEGSGIPNLGLVSGPYEGEATGLTGTGATFPSALFATWLDVYVPLTGVDINYQPTGSSAGIRGILDRSVNFGASEAALTDEQMAAANILHIPATLGAVVPTYNLPELGDTPVRFTPETLCLAFLGEAGRRGGDNPRDPIIKWNDPRLVADNPELANIDRFIVIVHRSDGSGTTDVFTNYLTTVCEDWARIVGRGTSVNWPTGIGARGNAGVAGNINQTPYSLGYVEKAFAGLNNLPFASVQNQAGNFVRASQETISLAAAEFEIPADLRVELVNAPGEASYPIVGFAWIMIYQEQDNMADAIALTRFLWWAIHDGQQLVIDEADDPVIAGYAPLPEPVIRLAEDMLLSVTVNGERALPAEIIAASDRAGE